MNYINDRKIKVLCKFIALEKDGFFRNPENRRYSHVVSVLIETTGFHRTVITECLKDLSDLKIIERRIEQKGFSTKNVALLYYNMKIEKFILEQDEYFKHIDEDLYYISETP